MVTKSYFICYLKTKIWNSGAIAVEYNKLFDMNGVEVAKLLQLLSMDAALEAKV
jgi:hypothetical protein